MFGKRRAKNGAARASTSCVGSNHATYAAPASSRTSRKRTNAWHLCTSRRTARSSRASRATSGSAWSSSSRGASRAMRQSAR
jgi:hypothetical protein